MSPNDLDGVLAVFRDAAMGASAIALDYFRPGQRTSAAIDYKEGGSPVSAADFAVDRFLRERLAAAIPEAAWLSEESAASPDRLQRRHVLIVDPIDGTRGFVSGDARWAVSIALVTDGRPCVGIVHAPVLDQSFTAVLGGGAQCNAVAITGSTRTKLAEAAIAVPGNIARQVAGPIPFRVAPRIPSLACRFAHVAAGFLDGCIAAPDAHDWDIAAADLILTEAGSLLTDRHGTVPLYNRPRPSHPALVAAVPVLHDALLHLLRRPSD